MGTRDFYNEIILNTNRTNLTNILFCTRISRITRILFAAGRSRVFEHELNESHEYFIAHGSHGSHGACSRRGAHGGLEHEIRRRSTNSCMSLPMTSYILF